MRDLLSVNMLRLLFGRKWWWTTLLVILGVGVLARLGIWQLDRLAQRRAFNARVSAEIAQPPLALTGDALHSPLTSMEYRSVTVSGVYDFSQQVALRNQAWDDGQATLRAGVHLLTPLVIAGADQAVLVDRGWIPLEESAPEKWSQFDEPGTVEVKGVIRYSESHADFGSITDPPGHLLEWNLVTLPRIGEQISHPLLPVYVEQAPDPSWTALPYRTQPELDLTEGPHLGYAIQWFTFAAILGIGYPFYVRQSSQTRRNRGQAGSLSYLEDTP
jgi:surfeit locus 1 family protein